ncbi:3 beta-hydroxysteroid dehydrogenase/Delta 5--_4-isomerase type 3-like [Tetranychus urticae]|uniref:3 beta-hydroxysteroid dehydrogenase/Delta 5-->4-isomerase type 3-like n=1 Tax=Tetranychus urticae TaxID=32264 RepID=UPI00077BCAF7|nr:3 beta-hydroxysteroid dehydrogenase/Delta 5-->4-isomerase type 3-like [Tetranychus urticae]XP_015785979.1 3 beta-hydroxysteroid dehydrogenase/Delta 5-->4-isomerase type 3-like [Tetranychus urticae]
MNDYPSLQSLTINKISVLVTGSSGFLGQHIIKLLQEQDDSVSSIVCFDKRPYRNNLGHKMDKPMKYITGDIRDEKVVTTAMEGVDCIIHCAAETSIDLKADEKTLYSVNVEGTENLLNCAVESNIRYFVYVSTADVICGPDPIYYGAENTCMVPKKPVLGPYASSKYEAELRVVKGNGLSLRNGIGRLSTVILRPTLLYGEEDPFFVSQIIKLAKTSPNNCLPRVDNVFTRAQVTYVGNAAWACLKAKDRLRLDPGIGGEEFIITDDTPVQDPFDFVKPYLDQVNCRVSDRPLPYWILIIFLELVLFLVILVRPLYAIDLPEKYNPRRVRYLCTTFFFNRNKSTLRLSYAPFYTPDDSKKRSLQYYSKL